MIKAVLRDYLLNFAILWAVTAIFPGLSYEGGLRTLAIGAVGLMAMNLIVIPILKVVFLPLNILTLGIFTWVINVIALYLLTTIVPQFKLIPYSFPGAQISIIDLPPMELNVLMVAILSSFLIGLISHILKLLI